MSDVLIIGAGLAGSEAAWQLAERGFTVELVDMKPSHLTPAHSLTDFAELVCSNSLRSTKAETASGVLKRELARENSLILKAAEETAVPAGNALAVDREAFPRKVSQYLHAHPKITIREELVTDLADSQGRRRIIATGPLTDGPLFESIQQFLGSEKLYFFDAAAPLIEGDSINTDKAFRSDRYDLGEGDYFNCPLNEDEYRTFYEALMKAERAEVHGFEKNLLFSGCQPVEALAEEGFDTLRFGPLKPVGIKDPHTGQEAYAVVQLRQDNFAASLWNMVGFQTRLKFPEQERVFRMIPGLEKARFARYGVMHRNSFISSPEVLTDFYRCKKDDKTYFAGQISGVEGYLESCSSGLLAALSMAADLGAEVDLRPYQSGFTVMGGLASYVTSASPKHFQPMKSNFSLLKELTREDTTRLRRDYGLKGRGRRVRRLMYALRAYEALGLDQLEIQALADSLSNQEREEN